MRPSRLTLRIVATISSAVIVILKITSLILHAVKFAQARYVDLRDPAILSTFGAQTVAGAVVAIDCVIILLSAPLFFGIWMAQTTNKKLALILPFLVGMFSEFNFIFNFLFHKIERADTEYVILGGSMAIAEVITCAILVFLFDEFL